MITSSELDNQLERLCNYTGNSFELNSWSTGHRRLHQLMMVDSEGDIVNVSSPLETREMYHFIEGYIETDKKTWDLET